MSDDTAIAIAPTQAVGLRVAGQLCAVPVAHARDAMQLGRIQPVPLSPDGVVGIFGWQGRAATAIDLRRCLHLPPANEPWKRFVLMVEYEGDAYGLIADAMGDVVTLPGEPTPHFPASLGEAWQGLGAECYALPRETLVMLDMEKLLCTLRAPEAKSA